MNEDCKYRPANSDWPTGQSEMFGIPGFEEEANNRMMTVWIY